MLDRKPVVLCALLLLFFSWLAAPGMAAAPAGETGVARVAILPFAMNTPANLNYLQSGVRDMLTSRLELHGKVEVVDKAETDRAVAKAAKEMSLGEAVRIGAAVKADHVLFGSITSTGQSVSIEAKMAPVSGKTEPVSFYVQTKSLDEVMPQIDIFAQQINQKVFGKPEDKTQTASAEAEALATRNPELLLPGASATGDKIAYLNPNFVEATPESSFGQSGFWRSQDFQGGILGMDVGDLDGDGKAEIVTIQMRKLTVYKKEKQDLREMDSFEGNSGDRFSWVSVAEVYSEGKSYIYLTNLRTTSSSGSSADGQGASVSSYVLTFSGGKLQVIAQGIPYYLNAIHLGSRGKVLVGQKPGDKHQSPFSGGVFEMQLRGGSLVPGAEINAPKEANLFNFAKADVNNDKVDEIILVDTSHKLHVLNSTGGQIWKAGGVWAATTNAFESKAEGHRWGTSDSYAVPSPVLVVDLLQKGTPEIVVNRNTTSSERWLSDSTKYAGQGEIVSLSWDKRALAENWKTKELNGQVTSVRIGDLEGSGNKQLVISMVYARDALKLYDAKSVIFTYDLNVKEAAAKAAPDERETVPIQGPEPVEQKQNPTPSMGRGKY
jgi:TolB-like protein